MIIVGLMSGTSADGVDSAIMSLSGKPPKLRWKLVHHLFHPYPAELQRNVLAGMKITATVDRICDLNASLGEFYASVSLTALAAAKINRADVAAIGCHGQTVWHNPGRSTLQLGEAAVLAERTGIYVVSNFRARDIAAGGQGAPLVAYVDQLLFQHDQKTRALQNLGGIGNVTYLPRRTMLTATEPRLQPIGKLTAAQTIAFDTGPANMVIDDIARRASAGALQCDLDGTLAATGVPHGAVLEELLSHSFFAAPPPKTTGREVFGEQYGEALWTSMLSRGAAPQDVAATATMLTATSIAESYRTFLPSIPDEVVLSGGGVRNPTLVKMISDCLHAVRQDITITTSDALGMPPEAKEAACFAILAYESLHGRPGNLPSATGATKRVVLGDITQG